MPGRSDLPTEGEKATVLLAGDLVAMFVLFVIRAASSREPDQPIPTGRRRRAVALLASRQLSDWPAAVYR
jgi:hypothetical protein